MFAENVFDGRRLALVVQGRRRAVRIQIVDVAWLETRLVERHLHSRGCACAGFLGKLAAKKINVTAVDAVSAGAGRYGAILWVKARDVNRAAKTLRV